MTPYPRPAALPSRPPYLVGVCVPTTQKDFPQAVWFPPEMFAAFRSIHLHSIRVDCDFRRDDASFLLSIAEEGFIPWPILSVWGLSEEKLKFTTAQIDARIAQAEVVFEQLAARCPWIVEWEAENEPGGRMSPKDGARIVQAVAAAVKRGNPNAKVYGPGTFREMFDPRSGKPDNWKHTGRPWYVQFREELATLGTVLDGQCIHPYHSPDDPDKVSRQGEHRKVLQFTGDLPIHCTEVGWDTLDHDRAGRCIAQELAIERDLGLRSCFLFSHQGSFGIFNDDWTPRPAALAVQAFLAPLPPLEYPSDPIDVPPPFDPPLGGPMPLLKFEFGDIPFDVHTRIKARIADMLTTNGRPTEPVHALDDDASLACYVDQTLKVGLFLNGGGIPGDYGQWENDVYAHTARELRRIFGLQVDPDSPPPLDFP